MVRAMFARTGRRRNPALDDAFLIAADTLAHQLIALPGLDDRSAARRDVMRLIGKRHLVTKIFWISREIEVVATAGTLHVPVSLITGEEIIVNKRRPFDGRRRDRDILPI